MQLNDADLLNVERELCRRSLAQFAQRAWHVLEPAAELKWGWALDAICQHLEAVTDGREGGSAPTSDVFHRQRPLRMLRLQVDHNPCAGLCMRQPAALMPAARPITTWTILKSLSDKNRRSPIWTSW